VASTSSNAPTTPEAVQDARSGKTPAASGYGGSSGASGDAGSSGEDSGFGSDDGFLVIEPCQAEFTMEEERFDSWKEKAEKRLARMQTRITELFQYRSSVSSAYVSGRGAAAAASSSYATIRLEEKTVLEVRKAQEKG
jgi:hypothetical protein